MKRRFTRLFDPNKRDVYEESSTLLRTSRSQDLFEIDIASGISLAVMSGLDTSKIPSPPDSSFASYINNVHDNVANGENTSIIGVYHQQLEGMDVELSGQEYPALLVSFWQNLPNTW